ncbi:GldG family protein [Myxococcota bacterium]|nr:GldG family protein [Myxococcota bacterium]
MTYDEKKEEKNENKNEVNPDLMGASKAKNLGRIAGAVGVVLWITAPFTWFLTLDFGPLVLSKMLFGTFLIAAYLLTNREFFSRVKGSRSSGLLVVSVMSGVIVFALVGVVNYVGYKNAKEYDFTKEGIHTLSKQTTTLLSRLNTEVELYAFFSKMEDDYLYAEDLLKRYDAQSEKLKSFLIDPQLRPDLVERYGITDRGPRIVAISADREARAKEPTEQALTNTIIKVTEESVRKVCFLVGHGETSISDSKNTEGYKTLAEAIRAEGYQVQNLSLIDSPREPQKDQHVKIHGGHDDHEGEGMDLKVPDDTYILVVGGARKAILEPEIVAISDYLGRGGRLLVLLDPDTETGLDALLAKWKVLVHKDLVVDTNPMNRVLGLGPAAPLVQAPEKRHAITAQLNAPVILFTARTLELAESGKAIAETQVLMEIGERAWGEVDLKDDGSASRDKADHGGPAPVAIASWAPVARTNPEKITDSTRLVVVGDSEWVNNKYLAMQANMDFALNSINWLAEEEDRISIRPKVRAGNQLFLTGEEMAALTFFSMDLLPLLFVALGLAIVLIRQQR